MLSQEVPCIAPASSGPPQGARCVRKGLVRRLGGPSRPRVLSAVGSSLDLVRAALTSSWGMGLWGRLECTLKLLDQ